MENSLIPLVEKNNLVAKIDPNIASEISMSLGQSSKITRITDMYFSRYGIMGYGEYNVAQESLGGIILVPKKLSLILQLMSESVWEEFKGKYFKTSDLEKSIEKLNDPRHIGVSFVDEIYYYGYHPDFTDVHSQMVDQIRDISDDVTTFLTTLDEYIDDKRGYRPTEPRDDFSRLQVRGFLPQN